MTARFTSPHPHVAPYAPTFGELVRDRTTDRIGTYMGPGFSKKRPTVFLRPPRGGYEWEVSVADIEPAPVEPELDAVTDPVTDAVDDTVNAPAPVAW